MRYSDLIAPKQHQKLTEMRVGVWSGATINVLHNPSRQAFERFREKCEVMRGLLSYDGNNLYLWDAYMAVHPNIIQELGLEHIDCIFYVRGQWRGDVFDSATGLYKTAIQRLTPYQPRKWDKSDDELYKQLMG